LYTSLTVQSITESAIPITLEIIHLIICHPSQNTGRYERDTTASLALRQKKGEKREKERRERGKTSLSESVLPS